MSDTNETYYQFPLCCLAFGADHVSRLRHLVDYCIVEVGRKIGSGLTMPELKEMANNYTSAKWPGGVRLSDRLHLEVVAGMKILGIHGGTVENTTGQSESLRRFISSTESTAGRYPIVRIRGDLIWDCIHGRMPFRELAVLAGVYAAIGSKTFPVRITRDRIRSGALGYKTPAQITPEALASRNDGAEPLTVNQVRYTLDHLEATSLINRVQLSPRVVYFSNRLTADEMRAKLIAWKTRNPVKLSKNRNADRDMQAKIKAAIKAVKTPIRKPRIHHGVTTASP